eukprot:TRINITY_DN972_c0_g4_i1.p1 TRINITY_DN972_c0_g4~~TRINITY_DN972_c0_g4_i1.p1  ORF type:complete len:291 (-),score=60.07 TRINITY_DN972_c0_g4_i1:132-1004(-)
MESSLSKIPSLGLGTHKGKTPADLVKAAIVDYGYRLIDTASYYENEVEIGQGIKAAAEKVPREDVFVVSKVWNDEKDDVEGALRNSLRRLQLDYLDLYLVHWPIGVCVDESKWRYKQRPMHKVWADMEACVRKGLCKRIGVSNFHCQLLVDILSYAEIPPAANQIELHPYCVQRKLVQYCLLNDITPIAYGPLTAPGKEFSICALKDPVIIGLAEKYKRTAAQICLQWGLANGHVVIPHTKSLGRLKENMEAKEFSIEGEDMKKIDELDRTLRLYDPNTRGEFGGIPIFS